MASTGFLPALSQSDISQAAQLIQQAYAPAQGSVSSDDQRKLQQELFDIQKKPEAWGLVIPFLENPDPSVQFFGAHTAQVKIARDWDSFPQDHTTQIRDLVLELTAHSVLAGRNKVILRKLFVTLTSLALKLAPVVPSQWDDWLLSCISHFSSRGVPTEHILDFLEIVAEEVDTADLLGPRKAQMRRSLMDAVPLVIQAITTSATGPRGTVAPSEMHSALKCFEAWIPILPASDLTPLIPVLISLLNPVTLNPEPEFDESTFVSASDALQEVMAKSALSDGSGSKTLTEPLLIWLDAFGGKIIQTTHTNSFVDPISHSLCKLLVALGDHSSSYLSYNLASESPAAPTPSPLLTLLSQTPAPPRSRLVQNYLQLLLSYTALPGYYGVDEDESDMTLGFWYLFQESLWATDYHSEDAEEEAEDGLEKIREQERQKAVWTVAKAVYGELVRVLRRKVVWPERGSGWAKDQRDKFQVYRRDVGDTLINAYYVLRGEMLGYFVNDIVERLTTTSNDHGWTDIEATLHCIMCIQEAVPVEEDVHLSRLFSSEILGRLPSTGRSRIRYTTLGLIGAYASWFTTQSPSADTESTPSLLMNAISYVVSALQEPALCFSAANALRDLCDANRTALAPHIGAFAELHAGLVEILEPEKSKVLQSIASVIQALPPEEEIPPVEAIVSPVVQKLLEALQISSRLPEEARTLAIFQLATLTGVAKGLTRTNDILTLFDDPGTEQTGVESESERVQRARGDIRMVKLRDAMFTAVRNTMELWSTDASVSDAVSEFVKSITSLPSDATMISLPPGPLLELVCLAAQRQLTAVWLSLASMLILQLDPPSLLPPTLKSGPTNEGNKLAADALPLLLRSSLSVLGQSGAMETNPDIVQSFFGCMATLAQHFIGAFFSLPPGLFESLMQCAISSLALQERYSLVSACTFLSALVNRTSICDDLADAKTLLIQSHGRTLMRAILCGFAGVAPRSATLNLIELLSTLVTRWPGESKAWMMDILFAEDFVPSKAGPQAKERFIKTISGSRSMKRTKEAAQQFILVARGLEGSSFGYASVSM